MPIPSAFQRYQSICPDWPAFLASALRPLPTTLWVNTRAIQSDDLLERMGWPKSEIEELPWRRDAFKIPDGYRPGGQPEYMAGFYHLQEEVSMIPPLLLDPQPGERILDLCAAPGNKTMQIALAMDDRGTVIGHDWNFNRLRILRTHSQRLGLSSISTALGNGCQLKGVENFFDRVLVDVPCSCEGTLRKNPRIIHHKVPPGALLYNGIQLMLLQKAVDACRPGGRIVYSTCTFRPEENEVIVDQILKANPTLRILPAHIPGIVASPGLTEFSGESFDSSLSQCLRIWPHQNDSGGFFIAVLEKARTGAVAPHSLKITAQTVDFQAQMPIPDPKPSGFEELAYVQDRFQFPEDTWEKLVIFHRSAKKLSYHPADHEIPSGLKLEELGQNLMKIHFQHPKLSTAAARVIGNKAQRNRVNLNRAEITSYMRGEDLYLGEDRTQSIASDGYVLVCYANRVIGLALALGNSQVYRLRSLFPRDWAQSLGKDQVERSDAINPEDEERPESGQILSVLDPN